MVQYQLCHFFTRNFIGQGTPTQCSGQLGLNRKPVSAGFKPRMIATAGYTVRSRDLQPSWVTTQLLVLSS